MLTWVLESPHSEGLADPISLAQALLPASQAPRGEGPRLVVEVDRVENPRDHRRRCPSVRQRSMRVGELDRELPTQIRKPATGRHRPRHRRHDEQVEHWKLDPPRHSGPLGDTMEKGEVESRDVLAGNRRGAAEELGELLQRRVKIDWWVRRRLTPGETLDREARLR